VNQCVCITLVVKIAAPVLKSFIQKKAEKLRIEGMGNVLTPHTIKIIAYGPHNAIDEFIDTLYAGCNGVRPSAVEVVSFAKTGDYRGVFRIIT